MKVRRKITMSKWINKDLFKNYVEEKEKEEERTTTRRIDRVWPTPEVGTVDKPKVYEGRFLPDPKGNFTKKYFYHGFKVGDKFYNFLCEKTYDMSNFCPFCTATQKLYMGNDNDKKAAYNYKRKVRNVVNWYIVKDPRDAERRDEDKLEGKVRIYEFPDKIDSKIKAEITDRQNGLGAAIFDPGPDGFNFILKAKSTKKDAYGKVWPDYADSTFARKSYPLGKTDEEINKIMKSTYDLDEHINRMRISDEDMMKILKTEMLWELVEEEWNKYKSKTPRKVAVEAKQESEDDVPWEVADSNGNNQPEEDSNEDDLDELLKEIDSMK